MCWLTKALAPCTSVNVFFRCGPTASSGRGLATGSSQRQRRVARARGAGGSGCSPATPHARNRRTGRRSRGRAAGTRRRSAEPRRASSLPVAIGSSLRLPLVMTSGRRTGRAADGAAAWTASMTPTVSSPGATAGERRRPRRRRRSTTGRSAEPAALPPRLDGPSAARSARVRTITASGFASPMLARAQPGHRRLARRVARRGGIRRARAAPGSHRAAAARRLRSSASAVRMPARGWPPARTRPRPAVGAAVGLGVIAAVAGSVVLRGARRTLGECPHAGALPVVRQRLDHREARPAVGAGDERVAVPPVAGSRSSGSQAGQIATSGGTGCRRSGSVRAPEDGEAVGARGGDRLGLHSVDAGERRRLARSARRNASSAAALPSTSIWTSPDALRTQPASPWRNASR